MLLDSRPRLSPAAQHRCPAPLAVEIQERERLAGACVWELTSVLAVLVDAVEQDLAGTQRLARLPTSPPACQRRAILPTVLTMPMTATVTVTEAETETEADTET